ncbi:kinetochore-associated Ndc80 complex subunit spc25 [Chytriomyces hyalinus]|nr:kinetochore-associated Ndc80 complex subunit spc25 [Chytriomyces hyalinus]
MESIARLNALSDDFDTMRATHSAFVEACEEWAHERKEILAASRAAYAARLRRERGSPLCSVFSTHSFKIANYILLNASVSMCSFSVFDSLATPLPDSPTPFLDDPSLFDQIRLAEAASLLAQTNALTAKAAELDRMQSDADHSVVAARTDNETLDGKRVALDTEKAALALSVRNLESELETRKKRLAEKRSARQQLIARIAPEAQFFADKLAMRIVTVTTNVLKFLFTHIDSRNWDREYSFILDVSAGRVYKLMDCSPKLPHVDTMVSKLNDTRDFYMFLKEMRMAFSEDSKREVEQDTQKGK